MPVNKNLKQEGTIVEYSDAFMSLFGIVSFVSDMGSDEIHFLDLFIGGLNPEIGNVVRRRNPKNLWDAYWWAKFEEVNESNQPLLSVASVKESVGRENGLVVNDVTEGVKESVGMGDGLADVETMKELVEMVPAEGENGFTNGQKVKVLQDFGSQICSVGNVGLIFTKGDLKEVSEEVAKYKVGAPARVGLVAPVDVVVPPGNTGLDPSQTTFFQVLNIPTKINKGTVKIITPVELIKKGEKVGSSEAALLSKLGIRPFSYALVVQTVYENGSVFSPEVLNLTEDDLVEKFAVGVSMVTSLSLAIHYPTIAAAPHMLINSYKNALAIAVETEYSFTLADKVKEYLVDPSKFAVAAPAASGGAAPAVAAAEEPKDEPAEESDDEMFFSLFDA